MCAGRPGSDNGEWTEHRLKTRPAASHARTAGGAAEGRRQEKQHYIWKQKSLHMFFILCFDL